jgi:hypothetical protein
VRVATLAATAAVHLLIAAPASGQGFTFEPPGALEPGSGQGLSDALVYFPGLRFPVEVAPAFLNSQKY